MRTTLSFKQFFKPGARLRIHGYQGISNQPSYLEKLLAMGLTPNTEFTVKHVAPLGDPITISVRDTALIVRKKEVAQLSLALVNI